MTVREIKPVTGKKLPNSVMGTLNNKSGNQMRVILDTIKQVKVTVVNEINQTIHSTN